jgi:hypothetical protein
MRFAVQSKHFLSSSLLIVAPLTAVVLTMVGTSAWAQNTEPFNVDSQMSPEELEAEFGDDALIPSTGSTNTPTPARVPIRIQESNPDRRLELAPRESAADGRRSIDHDTVRSLLTDELLSYYETVLYINKAARGKTARSTAQTMRISMRSQQFPYRWPAQMDRFENWQEISRFKVSTGREKAEKYFTSTPVGIFNIDRRRVYRMAYSKTWDDAPMPFAMFLDVRYPRRKSGIAIHAAPDGSEKKLGRRASGGCIRVPKSQAEKLFDWVTTELPGQVPQFAWDDERSQTSNRGEMKRDAKGRVVLKQGLKALVVVVDVRD